MTWRETAAPIIYKALQETKGLPENDIRKALRDAYPFGARKWHPYKIWLSEIANQRKNKSRVKQNINQIKLL